MLCLTSGWLGRLPTIERNIISLGDQISVMGMMYCPFQLTRQVVRLHKAIRNAQLAAANKVEALANTPALQEPLDTTAPMDVTVPTALLQDRIDMAREMLGMCRNAARKCP